MKERLDINVHGHKVSVEDARVVFINHNPNCKMPCEDTEKIITYLEDELFIMEGFSISDIYDKGKL